ncbi:23S rRNA (cytidine(2498)-2'-O)-methyltransferase RlmM [Glaciecola sp. SC05]|uniref:23S rRNA (cytidine(2498)-2'-O)-methyltransferase RlmM n=1 Tax=Glaciecola sp. SC05 TaxID=1987355 RepID=UPI00352716AD
MTAEFLLYCRSGYEADLLAEIDHKLSINKQFGYGRFVKDCGFIRYCITPSSHQHAAASMQGQYKLMLTLDDLIFARQKTLIIANISFPDLQDRVADVIAKVEHVLEARSLAYQQFGDIRVEYPDTEDGKQMAKFTKKFTVPLRSAMRKVKLLTKVENTALPYLHIFFEQGDACILSVSYPKDRSEQLLGVKRLKFPPDAPSRSTLKLEEAISQFCNKHQQTKLFVPSMSAVDLGACPGGWTYQLVIRGMQVEAVDNGAMDDKLMASGLVTYSAADGFTYKPKDGHVDWLVCDMIEQPDKVAQLMIAWLQKGWANAAIFNLKLPMKKRYLTLQTIVDEFNHCLHNEEQPMYMRAKHLYHNRDEVTFMIVKNSQMQAELIL